MIFYINMLLISAILTKFPISDNLIPYQALNHGAGCGTNLDITESGECQDVAKSLNFSGKVESGDWGHAPKGCSVGHPDDNYKYLYFNSGSGKAGSTRYKSICRKQAHQIGSNISYTKGNN